MRLALVGAPGQADDAAWTGGSVPAEHAIRGFHGITLLLRDAAPTASVLTDVLGFVETARAGAGRPLRERHAGRRPRYAARGSWPTARAAGNRLGAPRRLPRR